MITTVEMDKVRKLMRAAADSEHSLDWVTDREDTEFLCNLVVEVADRAAKVNQELAKQAAALRMVLKVVL